MTLDDLTIGEAKKLAQMFSGVQQSSDGPWKVGTPMLIRTVTNYWTGRIVAIYPMELVLEDAAWIASTGRFSEAFERGVENLDNAEVEPVFTQVVIGRGAIIDAGQYDKPLPRRVK